MHLISLVVSLSLIFCLVGCSQQQEVSYKSGGMTQTMAHGKNAVPQEFAELVFPDATTTGSVSAEGENAEQSKFLMLSCSDSVANVAKWYQEQLKNQKWQIDKVQDMPKLVSISGHKDDLELNVMVAEDNNKTTISLSAGKQVDGSSEDKEAVQNYTPDKLNPPTD